MAGRATIIIQGTAWGVRETQNGKRYLSVSVSPGYRDRNGNWVSQPEQYYSVWPAGYANLNPVFDQIAQLRQNQDQFVDVTIVGEISVASSEQSTGVAQVGEAITQMDQATQQNAALVEQSAAAAAHLQAQSAQLVQAMAVFQLDPGQTSATPARGGAPARRLAAT